MWENVGVIYMYYRCTMFLQLYKQIILERGKAKNVVTEKYDENINLKLA